jgi:crossover junction endodeoxyribonuclease RuvC
MPDEKRETCGPVTILGIDPGSQVLGWGAVRWEGGSRVSPISFGAIRVKPGGNVGERLTEIHRRITEVLSRIQPAVVCVEEVFYGKSFQSALRIGEARGVCLLAAASCGIETRSYAAAEIKQAVTGNGRAHKSQVGAMVARILGLQKPPTPADAADALACALCHSHRLTVGRFLGR